MKKSIVKRFISILLVLVMICCCCISASAYQEGVTKVQVNHWGMEVYISKTAIKCISDGIDLGSMFIPVKIVEFAVSALGKVISNCPGGIVLEYHYFGMALKMLNPMTVRTLPMPTNFRWQ